MVDFLNMNLDDILGTTINPVGGLLTPDQTSQFDTTKGFQTLLGGLQGYGSQLYQGKSPLQKILGAYTGAKSGRQSVIDAYSKGFLTKAQLGKALQDMEKGKYELRDLKQIQLAKDVLSLQYPDRAAEIYAATDEVIKGIIQSDPRFRKLKEMDVGTEAFARSQGIDLANPTQDDYRSIAAFETAPTEKDVMTAKAEQSKALIEGGSGASDYLQEISPSKYDIATGNVQQGKVEVGNVVKNTQKEVEKAFSNDTYTPEKVSNVPLIFDKRVPLKDRNAMILRQPQAFDAMDTTINNLNDLKEALLTLKDHAGLTSATGFGSWFNTWLAGTDAADAERYMKQIQATTFMSALQELKSQSETGATGFGQLAVKEGELIQNSVTKLNKISSKDEALKEIDRLIRRVDRLTDKTRFGFDSQFGSSYRGKKLTDTLYPNPTKQIDIKQIDPRLITGENALPSNLIQQGKINAFTGKYLKDQYKNNKDFQKLDNNKYYIMDKKGDNVKIYRIN